MITAVKAGKVDGVGFVFTAEDDYVGIDLDGCIDPDTGAITNEAIAIVNAINSYTEISPSGTGLHIIAKGTLPPGRRRKGGSEAYEELRYFTFTGNILPGTPATIEERTAALAEFHRIYLADPEPKPTPLMPRGSGTLGDLDLIQRARAARNGHKFSKLFDGDFSDYPSQSEGDLALVSGIAFWTPDADQIDRIFRMSGLVRRKWHREDYRDSTIEKALAGRTEFYEPARALTPPPIAGGAPLPEPAANVAEGDPQAAASRPAILTSDRQLRELTEEALAALVASNAPARLFIRGEALVRVQRDEADRPTIRVLGLDQMIAELTEAADFYKENKRGERRDAPPPKDLAANILAQSQWPFPPLRSIVEQPIVRPNGTVVDQPGYDPATRVFYAPAPDLIVPPIPDHPSPTEIQAARSLIEDELLGDFPFDSNASRAHAVAMLLTPAVREAIKGAIPIAIVDKPQAGAGASLLADCVAHIVTGRPAGMMTAPQREEEWGKSLLAIAETGSPQITVDNVDRVIRSSALSSAVTAGWVYGRRLGSSTIVHVPWRAQIVITGNNVRFAGDIGRRVFVVRIDPQMARPWRREGFRHPNLSAWAQAQRGPLLGGILTLVRAW